MRLMKFVTFALTDNPTVERLYLLPQEDSHKDFVERATPPGWRPVRAGQVMHDCGRFCCTGSSMTLMLMADEDKDTDLLLNQIDYAGPASQAKRKK